MDRPRPELLIFPTHCNVAESGCWCEIQALLSCSVDVFDVSLNLSRILSTLDDSEAGSAFEGAVDVFAFSD